MKTKFTANKIILPLILLIFLLTIPVHAQQKLGIIIVADSGNPQTHSIALDMEDLSIKLRDLNISKGELKDEIIWVKTYDYAKSNHADFIKSVLKISRDKAPFIGIAYLNSDNSFSKFTDKMKAGNVADPVKTVENIFKEITEILTSLDRNKFTVKISGLKLLETKPEGASVYINGKLIGKTPVKNLLIIPGANEIVIKKSGYEEIRENESLPEGMFETLKLVLPKKRGEVEISSEPSDAWIMVDSRRVGKTPDKIKLAPGTHKITVRKLGFKPQSQEVTVSSDSKLTREFKLESDKVKCYLDVRGHFSKIKVPDGSGGEEEKTFIIDQYNLTQKLKEVLEKKPLVEMVSKKEEARVYILYEVVPKLEMEFKLKIEDNKKVFQSVNRVLKGKLPVGADNEKLVDISVRVFEKKLMRNLRNFLVNIKRH